MAKPQNTVRTRPLAKRSWLDGPPPRLEGFPGDRLGLPARGRGSVAWQGSKLGAYVIDLVLSALVSFVIVRPHDLHREQVYNLVGVGVFVVMTAIALALSGRTPGMVVLGLQVVRLDGRTMGWRALPRQVLCGLLIPALVTDRDRRGLHDKPVGTVVVNVR